MLPSSAELTYFFEVANTKNLSRAAEKMGMSQPSLSLAIKRLEKFFGVDLFIRHKQGVTLTKAGKKLLTQVKKLLQQWENTKLNTIASHREVQGEVTIGCHTTVGLFLHKVLYSLLQQFPKLSFHLKHDVSQKTTEKIINSTIDIGIVTNPLKHPDLIMRKLNISETTFWKGKGLNPSQDVSSDKLVIICDPDIPQTHILLKKWKKNIKSARIVTTNSLEIVANLTANGCGIGILPSCFIHSIYPDNLTRIPNTPVCADGLYLIYRKENKGVKSIEIIIETIKNFLH